MLGMSNVEAGGRTARLLVGLGIGTSTCVNRVTAAVGVQGSSERAPLAIVDHARAVAQRNDRFAILSRTPDRSLCNLKVLDAGLSAQ
jgi:hypothetical protein